MTDAQRTVSLWQTAGLSASLLAITLTALIARYPDSVPFKQPRLGAPHRAGQPLVGSLLAVRKNTEKMHDFFLDTFKELNAMTFVLASLGLRDRIVTVEPRNVEHVLKDNFGNYVKGPDFLASVEDLLGHGIFGANGAQWQYQRKTASRIFNTKNFRDHFTNVFLGHIQILSKHVFDEAAEQHKPVNFEDVMYRFTLDSFVLIGFGIQLSTLQNKGQVPFAVSFDACQVHCAKRTFNPIWRWSDAWQGWMSGGKSTFQQHVETINTFAEEVIRSRQEAPDDADNVRNDLLSQFMHAKNERGEPLNDKEMRDVVLNFIIAGRDTTAQALSWTLYNLMKHPDVEARLREEIDATILPEHENDPKATYDAIKSMNYAHAVWHEVLRLHPSVPSNSRYALADDVLPCGTHVKKGDNVTWSPWAQARIESVWGPDAAQFKPERWLSPQGELQRVSAGQWPVFHAGPRVCLGQTLATLEALIALTSLVKCYRFTLVPGQDITYKASLTLPMKNGMNVLVEKRTT